jgi:hypothetical protein
VSLLKQLARVNQITHVFIATFWSDRETGFTEIFRSLEAAQRFCGRKKWKSFGTTSGQTWVCETNLGIYKIRKRRIRGRA